MKKVKKILPIIMAVIMTAVSAPVSVWAAEAAPETEQNADATTAGTDNTTAAEQGSTEGTVQGTEQNSTATDGTVTDSAIGKTETGTTSDSAIASGSAVEGTKEEKKEDTQSNTKSGNVVTLGENLSEEQKAAMYTYFGADKDKVRTIIVTHADEVKYMEGIATAEQIGATTNSCAYVEPTSSGGIKVKTANLNFVTSAMIASTLLTAGMKNCNVIAACPFEVSGTGALTGIMMAYETASGESLDEGKKEAAVAELITTGNLADSIGQEKASEVMNDVKTEVIDKGITDTEKIGDAVDKIADKNEITLTEEDRAQIVALMEQISKFDYDVKSLKNTLDNLTGEEGFFTNMFGSIKNFFVGTDDGILSQTNDEALGGDVVTDSTVDESGYTDGLWTRIKNFFKGD